MIDLNNPRQYVQLPPVTLSGTLVDILNLPSHVTRVDVKIANMSTTGTSIPILQIGDSGGIVTSGYSGDVSVVTSAPAVSAGPLSTGLALSTAVIAATQINGEVTLSRVTPASNLWTMSFIGSFQGGGITINSASIRGLTNVLDRLRLTTFGGVDTFDGGTISVSYI